VGPFEGPLTHLEMPGPPTVSAGEPQPDPCSRFRMRIDNLQIFIRSVNPIIRTKCENILNFHFCSFIIEYKLNYF
jgi:hypothetical protein